MKQLSYTLSVLCFFLLGALWVRAQTIQITGVGGSGAAISGTLTNPDVIIAAGASSIEDGGTSVGTIGGLNVNSSTIPSNGIYLPSANTVGIAANGVFIASFFNTAGGNLTIGGAGSPNASDMLGVGQNANVSRSVSFTNPNSGSSATAPVLYFSNNTSSTEVSMTLNSSANTSGNGANSFTIASAGTFWIKGGSTNSVEIDASGLFYMPSVVADTGKTDRTVCEDTTNHQFYSGTGAAGICLGTSAARFKHDIRPIDVGIAQLMKLEAISYRYNEGYGDPNKTLYGFTAEQGVKALPKLVSKNAAGELTSFDYVGVVPVLVRALQEQQKQLAELKKCVRSRHCSL